MLGRAASVAVGEAPVREGQPLGGHGVVADVSQRAQVVQRWQAHQVWPQALVHFKDDQRCMPRGAAQQPLGPKESLVLLKRRRGDGDDGEVGSRKEQSEPLWCESIAGAESHSVLPSHLGYKGLRVRARPSPRLARPI